MRLFLVEVPSH